MFLFAVAMIAGIHFTAIKEEYPINCNTNPAFVCEYNLNK